MRRAGFLATLAAGFSLLGVALHGMTSVDRTLKLAATPTSPVPHHGCHRGHHPDGPQV